MMLESMVAPVPSEGVMPFAGCLVASGRFTFFWVGVWSTLGSLVGSWLSYAMGYYGGRPFVTRFGRYLLLNLHDLEVTERFFQRRGPMTIFIARFIPVVRHLISIPAGVGKMNLLRFSIYTAVGACIWNMFLTWLGFHMGTHWELIHEYGRQIDIFMIIPVSVGIYFFIKTHRKRKARQE
ncbi:MAG: DedA family protein [Candidatus Eisenbacteria bacterium]|nr:DedA family protein [Candidatus Eisenbacteria bacterium]